MMPLVLAAMVAAHAELQTLAGVTLGSNIEQVLLEHPTGQRPTGSGRCCCWSRPGGGTVTVSFNHGGNVTKVDFQADKGENDKVDLPCVGPFPVQSSDAKLNLVLAKTACSAFNGVTYGLPDHSVVEVHFSGAAGGQLAEAAWYRPSDLTFMDYLVSALPYVGGFARIDYAGECATKGSGLVQQLRFPLVPLQPPSQGTTGMDAIRQILRDDPNAIVTQDRSGMLRITIGSVSSTVLQTKLPSLSFDQAAQYTPLSAIDTIAITADIYAKQHGLAFGLAPYIIDHLVSGPINGAPHLPSRLQNTTVDDALDAVARTFKGIVAYGECTDSEGKILFRPGFIYGP